MQTPSVSISSMGRYSPPNMENPRAGGRYDYAACCPPERKSYWSLFQKGRYFITESRKRPLMAAGRLPIDGNLGNNAGSPAADEIPLARPGLHRKRARINGRPAAVGVTVDGFGVFPLPLSTIGGILCVPCMGHRHFFSRLPVKTEIPGTVQGINLTGVRREKRPQYAAKADT